MTNIEQERKNIMSNAKIARQISLNGTPHHPSHPPQFSYHIIVKSGGNMKWIINTTKVLIFASATSWVTQNVNTETNYDTLAAASSLEGNSFKTYIIISVILGGIIVVAMTPLMTLLFGTLDTSSSQAALILTGITIIATTPPYKLLTTPSVILGSLLIVLGICLKASKLAQELNAPQDYYVQK